MHVAGFPDKDGLDKLVKLGKALCTLVATFSPILLKKYPDNPAITGLLAAIASVCALLPDIEATFLVDYANNDGILDDPSSTLGINPSLPPASSPDLT